MAANNITDKNTLKSWFQRGLKPLEAQFHAWMDAYWHKSELIPTSSIDGLENVLNQKAESVAVNYLSQELIQVQNDLNEKVDKEAGKGLMPIPDSSLRDKYYLNANGNWVKLDPWVKVLTMTINKEEKSFTLDADELEDYLKACYDVESLSDVVAGMAAKPVTEAYLKYAPYGLTLNDNGTVDDVQTVWHYLKVIRTGTEYGGPKLMAYEFDSASTGLGVKEFYCNPFISRESGGSVVDTGYSLISTVSLSGKEYVDGKLDHKVDKVEGKELSSNDYTDNERAKVGHLGIYVTDVEVSEETSQGSGLGILVHTVDPVSGMATSGETKFIPLASPTHNGLMSPEQKLVLDRLTGHGGDLSISGTPSQTWQLNLGAGPKLKNSGGVFELRNAEDTAYTDVVLNHLTIKGNITQEGHSFITDAETVEVKDNTILLNKGEAGSGVTRGIAGIEIDRGSLPRFDILFDESDDRFKAGSEGDLWPIMLRDAEADLTDGLFLSWDSVTKRAATTNRVRYGDSIIFPGINEADDFHLERFNDSISIGTLSQDVYGLAITLNKGFVRFEMAGEVYYFDHYIKAPSFRRSSDDAEVVYEYDLVQKLASYALKTDLPTSMPWAAITGKPEIPSLSGYATEAWVQSRGYLTSHQDLSGYMSESGGQFTGAVTSTSSISADGGFFDTSDRRLKSDIKAIGLKEERIKLYEFQKQNRHGYGVIAQEIETLYPSVVRENEDGVKTVNYSEILIIKCAEQDERIEELRAENEELKKRIEKLEQFLLK